MQNFLVVVTFALLAMFDMAFFGPTGFRLTEVLFYVVFLFETITLSKLNIASLKLVAITIPMIAVIFFYGEYLWFIKVIVLFALGIQLTFRPYRICLLSLLGVMIGFTAFSIWLIWRDDWFLAKYSAIHCAIFLIFALTSKQKVLRVAFWGAFVLGAAVAWGSRSRGQFLLVLLMLGFYYLAGFKTIRFKKAIFFLVFLMPFASLPIKILFLDEVRSIAFMEDVNAGDLERSILGVYSLSSITSDPAGQRAETIQYYAGGNINDFVDTELNTISAHNFVEDAMLFGGSVGLVIAVFSLISLANATIPARSELEKNSLNKYVLPLVVFSFVAATSPLAGLERLEILLMMALVGVWLRDDQFGKARRR